MVRNFPHCNPHLIGHTIDSQRPRGIGNMRLDWGTMRTWAMKSLRGAAVSVSLAALGGAGGLSAHAATLQPPFDATYSLVDLGSAPNVPTNFGGLFILPGQPNTLYLGGSANNSAGSLYAVPIARDSNGLITGFAGPGTRVADAPYNDGGIVPDPGGLISYAQWPTNVYAQIDLATGLVVNTIDLAPFGIASASAAVAFIPGGYPGAGGMRIASYGGGQFYSVAYSVRGRGLIHISAVTALPGSQLPGGPEGWAYVPLGSPQFSAPSMIVSEYAAGNVAVYDMDTSGNPVIASRRLFLSGLAGAEGAAIDPVSGSFIFSTFGGSNRVVVVRGFATPPSATLTPPTLNFAARALSTTSPPQTATLTNHGPGSLAVSSITANGDFAFTTACPATVAAGATCTIDVTFTPLAAGARTGTLSVASNASGSPHAVALSGTGQVAPAPVIQITPQTLDFPPQAIGIESAAQIVTVANTGNATLFFGPISATGDYARRPVPPPAPGAAPRPSTYDGACNIGLAAGTSCDLAVAFLPTDVGIREGLLRIESNATQQPVTVRLIGTGFVAVPLRLLSVPASLPFASQPVGTRSAGAAVTITNNSASEVAIVDLSVSGDFTVSDTCTTVPAHGRCLLLVTFRPTAEGDRAGVLTLRALSETEPYTVILTGSGVFNAVPALEVSVTRAGFGNTLVGTTSTLEANLVNVGEVAVALGAITATGDFLVSHTCGTSLAVRGSCPVQVTFLPRMPGPQVGILEVNSNAAGSPHQVQFSGIGCSLPSFARARLHPLLCAP
jgi:hypothetical protein